MQWDTEFSPAKIRLAAELAREGSRRKPRSIANWLILGRALIRLGEFQEAATCLRQAIALLPRSAELERTLAEALIAQDLFEDALPHAEAAFELAPDNSNAKGLYFSVLALLHHWDRLGAHPDSVATFSASNHRLMGMQARARGPEDTVRLCDRQLEADPGHTNAKYLKALALAALGRMEEARNLIALDRLIEISDLAPPPGYAGDLPFREALAREIQSNPTLGPDPRGRSTCDGLQTRCLRQPDAVAIEALLPRLREAVDAYERRLAASDAAFAMGRPQKARLQVWAVAQGSAGRQKAHRHPLGWVSGVYYVAAPRSRDGNGWGGPLLVGALDPEEHGIDPPWGTLRVDPVPGRLVLFPSYVPHATEPSGVDGVRLCVAFDAVPVRQGAN